jgi:hypothetical protein
MAEGEEAETGRRPQRPRSPRVPVDFPVEVEGETAGGEPFRVQARAVKVSRMGATIVTDVELEVGARLRVTPPYGRAIEAEVNGAWVDKEEGRRCVGIKLLDDNGWFAD